MGVYHSSPPPKKVGFLRGAYLLTPSFPPSSPVLSPPPPSTPSPDSTQHAAQGERISNSDQLNQLMESIACGHVFMEPQQQVRAVHGFWGVRPTQTHTRTPEITNQKLTPTNHRPNATDYF